MCIIIDANKIDGLFSVPPTADAQPILDWFDEEKNRVMIYPARGEFAEELMRVASDLLELSRKGVAVIFKDKSNKIEPEKKILRKLKKAGKCKSNDIPILALARVSGVRLLYTADRDLITDFKNREIINPKGKIYSSARNKDILDRSVCKKITEQPINSAQNEDYDDTLALLK